MVGKRTSKISICTQNLLTKGESEKVDYKRTADSVSVEDFVSFANTDKGGSILIGVNEASDAKGVQVGVVVGCGVDDATILQLSNKALSCIPPIKIIINVESTGNNPFLRVDVPPSTIKPHCTPKGIYARRDGSRNRALHPGELLKIFVEGEARIFARNFEAAAGKITTDLNALEGSLEQSIRSMGERLGWADYRLDDTESTLDTILSLSTQQKDAFADVSARLRALFRQDKREDPVRSKARQHFLDQSVEKLSNDLELQKHLSKGGTVSVTANGKAALELDEEELRQVLKEALNIVSGRTRPKTPV